MALQVTCGIKYTSSCQAFVYHVAVWAAVNPDRSCSLYPQKCHVLFSWLPFGLSLDCCSMILLNESGWSEWDLSTVCDILAEQVSRAQTSETHQDESAYTSWVWACCYKTCHLHHQTISTNRSSLWPSCSRKSSKPSFRSPISASFLPQLPMGGYQTCWPALEVLLLMFNNDVRFPFCNGWVVGDLSMPESTGVVWSF